MAQNEQRVSHDEARRAAITLARFTHDNMSDVLRSITSQGARPITDSRDEGRAQYHAIAQYRREASLVARLLQIVQ